jgi:sugar phosphate isomerase/epimerase
LRLQALDLGADQGLVGRHDGHRVDPRAWNYVALGHGHDAQWWKEYYAVARYIGYDGPVSLEMEDMSMDPLTGVKKSVATLKQALPRDFA